MNLLKVVRDAFAEVVDVVKGYPEFRRNYFATLGEKAKCGARTCDEPAVETFVPGNPLTPQEYEDRVKGLARARTSDGKQISTDAYQDREFLLLVDLKLGRDFSEGKRKELLEAHRAMREQRNKLIKDYLAYSFLPFSSNRHMKRVNDLLHRLLVVFESILTPAEFRAFTGCSTASEGHSLLGQEA